MPVTDDYYIENQPGAPFRAELNTILAALAVFNMGSTEPPNPQPGMPWLDTSTSPAKFKRRNDQNTGWVEMYDSTNPPSKAAIGIPNVENFGSTGSLTDGSANKNATAEATKALEDKKLDKTSEASDSAKLGGVAASSYARQTGDYSGLRARGTTKEDVDLPKVNNYGASPSLTLNSNTTYAVSSTVYNLNLSKLGKTEQAADSAKLGGKLPTAFANSVHAHSAADLPVGTTSAPGILQILDSTTSTSKAKAAAPNSIKVTMDKANSAYNLANTAKGTADAAMPRAGGNQTGFYNFIGSVGSDILRINSKTLLKRISNNGGVSFGCDDALIFGCGEARNTLESNVSAVSEAVHIGSDGTIHLYTNLQSGWTARKRFDFESDGGFLPGNVAKTRQNLNVPSKDDVYPKSDVYPKDETYNQSEIHGLIPSVRYALVNFGVVKLSQRYVKNNPFGNNPFFTVTQVLIDGEWETIEQNSSDYLYNGIISGMYGLNNEHLVVTVATRGLRRGYMDMAHHTGPQRGATINEAQCQVHCWSMVPPAGLNPRQPAI